MNARVAAIQTKTFLEADEQKRNIERAGAYVAEHGLAMICSPEEILIESLKPGIFIADCDFERIRWLREQRDLYGPPMPWRAKPGVLRDWRRPEVYRKNFPDW